MYQLDRTTSINKLAKLILERKIIIPNTKKHAYKEAKMIIKVHGKCNKI
jgi:hypothetical protein